MCVCVHANYLPGQLSHRELLVTDSHGAAAAAAHIMCIHNSSNASRLRRGLYTHCPKFVTRPPSEENQDARLVIAVVSRWCSGLRKCEDFQCNSVHDACNSIEPVQYIYARHMFRRSAPLRRGLLRDSYVSTAFLAYVLDQVCCSDCLFMSPEPNRVRQLVLQKPRYLREDTRSDARRMTWQRV